MRCLQRLFLYLHVEGVLPAGGWEANRERKIGFWGVKKNHVVPGKGLVLVLLLESQHESPITGSCAWVLFQLGLSSGVSGAQTTAPNSFKVRGVLVTN